MTTQTWHVPEDRLAAYLGGGLTAIEDASVEQHLLACASCRAGIRSLSDASDLAGLDDVWHDLATVIHRPPLPIALRLARRCGLGEPTAVLLAATSALRTAWLCSALVAIAFALTAAHLSRGDALWPFLLVAPLVPVLGVATAYGPSWDPLEGLVVTAPYGRTRLILVRTMAVLVTCLPMAALLGLLLPGPGWVAVAWLGPALAMVPVQLALASFVGPRSASLVVTLAWGLFVAGSIRPFGPTWPVEPDKQVVFVALALAATVVLAVRSRASRKLGVVL